MRFIYKKTVIASSVSALALAGCLGGGDSDTVETLPPANQFEATIRYTSYGVPHITATDFKGAAYAYGYAFAKDNICVYAEELVDLRRALKVFW